MGREKTYKERKHDADNSAYGIFEDVKDVYLEEISRWRCKVELKSGRKITPDSYDIGNRLKKRILTEVSEFFLENNNKLQKFQTDKQWAEFVVNQIAFGLTDNLPLKFNGLNDEFNCNKRAIALSVLIPPIGLICGLNELGLRMERRAVPEYKKDVVKQIIRDAFELPMYMSPTPAYDDIVPSQPPAYEPPIAWSTTIENQTNNLRPPGR